MKAPQNNNYANGNPNGNKGRLIGLPLITLALAGLAYTVLPAGSESDLSIVSTAQAREGLRIPAPSAPINEPTGQQVAIFAGGCFWGIEGVFDHVKGVISAESGYAGGGKANANYRAVAGGRTRHTEAVRIVYDPSQVSYNELMRIFFSVGLDPTQLNRQGPDTGSQYRNAIFPLTKAQAAAARGYLAQLSVNSPWGKKPVTAIESGSFYRAETVHQNYMAKHPNEPYIRAYDAPKLVNLKRLFPKYYR
ncbi:MAG: peptide-methionine (S)-S-oxide reductase MsrA [Sphingorhabdus sp.]